MRKRYSWIWLAGAVVALATVAPVVVQGTAQGAAQQKPVAPAPLAGKWQMTLEMEAGTSSPVLVFKQEGDKLSGTYTGRYGEYPLVGKVVGRAIEFVVTINAEGTETHMRFAGELAESGTLIKGTADLGGMGEATWLAKKSS